MQPQQKQSAVSGASFNHDDPWYKNALGEVQNQMKTALPALWGMLLYKVPWLISLHFVGQIGSEELAAAALASTLCNVTGLSLSVGLSSAITTLTGQARGDLLARLDDQRQHTRRNTSSSLEESDPEIDSTSERTPLMDNKSAKDEDTAPPLMPLVFLYRGLLIQLLFVIPIGLWWLSNSMESLLLRLGQGEKLAHMTAAYLKVLTPGLWSYSINWTLTAWLQAIEMADVPAYAAACGLVLHIPFNLLFIYTLGMGYMGVGVATVSFQLIQPFVISIYAFFTKHGSRRVMQQIGAKAIGRKELSFWNEARAAVSLRGVWQYLGLALPGIVIISEWWASEIVIFLSGRLIPDPDVAIGAMTIYQSINTFCFMFPVATAIAGSTRVSNLLGAGKSREAAFASRVAIGLAALLAGTMGITLYASPHSIFPRFFTPDHHVVYETSHLIPILSLYVFADGIQSAFNGIIKGCGRQVMAMPIVIVAYWIVGVPFSYYLAFVRNDKNMYNDDFSTGVVGLVIGMTTGTWVHMLLLGIVVVFPIQWEEEALLAKERLSRRIADKTVTEESSKLSDSSSNMDRTSSRPRRCPSLWSLCLCLCLCLLISPSNARQHGTSLLTPMGMGLRSALTKYSIPSEKTSWNNFRSSLESKYNPLLDCRKRRNSNRASVEPRRSRRSELLPREENQSDVLLCSRTQEVKLPSEQLDAAETSSTARGGGTAAQNSRPLFFWETMICGAISRSVAQTVMHPANTMKTMLQNSKGPMVPAIMELIKPSSFHRLTYGAGTNFLLSVPTGALNFSVLEFVRKHMGQYVESQPALRDRVDSLTVVMDFLSSSISTITVSIVATPTMMLTDNIMVRNYDNLPQAVKGLYRSGGIKAFYRGWLPGMMGKIPSYALTWTLFQQFKAIRDSISDRPATNVENSIMGALASTTTVCIMIPLDTIKTRLVVQGGSAAISSVPYKGIGDCAVRVLREEGIGAFYRGLPPRLVSVVPMIGIQFTVYEAMKRAFLQRPVKQPEPKRISFSFKRRNKKDMNAEREHVRILEEVEEN